jgi:NAD(P)-dependent dehydrogenase (short-subunit alcohol dehydrogenase family)
VAVAEADAGSGAKVPWVGHRALVTGSNGGLGAAIVARLRADGYEVVTLDVLPPADFVVDLAADPVPGGELGEIDVCVSNAGIVDILSPAHRMSHEKWDRDLAVNLTGSFRVVQACLTGMRQRRYGRIVVMSSVAAAVGAQGQVAYAASKAGLIGMVKSIAAENAGLGITANAVLPGVIATEKVLAMPPEVLEHLRERFLPTGRLGEPDEVAALVAFLASDLAGYITGQALVVDGGASLNPITLGSPK